MVLLPARVHDMPPRLRAFGPPKWVERSSALARALTCKIPEMSWPEACRHPFSPRRRKSCEEQSRGRARAKRARVGDASA
jgi:hypothetical protein